MRSANTVILFTKSPRICRVKTRMRPHFNHRKRLYLHKMLAENIIRQYKNQAEFQFVIYTAGISNHSFSGLRSIPVKKQRGFNLGMRMIHAIENELKHSQRVILIGSDSFATTCQYISNAFKVLKNNCDIVLGPTEDGGYVLVGMSKAHRRIFQRIAWGTDQVIGQTLRNAAGYRVGCLKKVQDIDTYQDLIKINYEKGLPSWAGHLLK